MQEPRGRWSWMSFGLFSVSASRQGVAAGLWHFLTPAMAWDLALLLCFFLTEESWSVADEFRAAGGMVLRMLERLQCAAGGPVS